MLIFWLLFSEKASQWLLDEGTEDEETESLAQQLGNANPYTDFYFFKICTAGNIMQVLKWTLPYVAPSL